MTNGCEHAPRPGARSEERGITAIEYAVMASAIVAIVVAAMAVLGPKILAAFTAIAS